MSSYCHLPHSCPICEAVATERDALKLELAQLKAIIDKLPKCWRLDDGKLVQDVPVLPGMTLWSVQIWDIKRIEVVSLDDLTSSWPATVRADFQGDNKATTYRWHVQGCYSTLEAAEEAKL